MTALFAVGRVLALWRPHAWRLAAGVAISLAALLCGVALTVRAGGTAALGATGAASLLGAALLLRALGAGRILGRYAERLVTHDATFRALADLRVWFFQSLAATAAGGLGFRRSGDLLSRLVADVEALDALYLRILVPLVGAAVLLPCLLLVIGPHDWPLACLVAALFALGAFVLPAFAARATLRAGERLARDASSLRVAVLDTVTGIREVRVFGVEGRMLADIQGRESRLIDAQLDLARSASIADAAAFVVGQAALLAVLAAIVAGFGRGDAHAALAATVAVFLVLSAFEFASGMPRAGVLAGHAAAAARRVIDGAGSPGRSRPVAGHAAPPRSATLAFEQVTFGWRPGQTVLDNLTLDIPEGTRIAILGPSGAGKSTFADLALGIVPPAAGRITLGGIDIATLPVETLRRQVALLSQATHLFADTIRANLLVGRRDATDAELWSALDEAAIGDWVRALPDGLETWVGENATLVSGGQGRRLALARTLLSNARVIILDEPASGLDGETERAFMRTLFSGADRRTIILIAHRLTGVERLDRIWRLQGGRIAAAAA
jgi:ATP-binding cassette subfamily C protein CydC